MLDPGYIVTIAISTFGERLNDAMKMAQRLDKNEALEVLIVHQISEEVVLKEFNLPSHVRYLSSNTSGAAASRNVALLEARGEYIWFMDDDIVLADNAVAAVFKVVHGNKFDIAILNISFTNDFSPFSVNVNELESSIVRLNYYKISSIGTPRIIVRSTFGKTALFPESYGAGTLMGIGDEPIYLSRLLEKDCVAIEITLDFMKHPVISSGVLFKNKIKLRIQVYLKIYGFRGFLIFLIKKVLNAFNR